MAWSPGEEDAKLARANGHKLQQMLQPITSAPETSFLDISCVFAETSEGSDIQFEPRRCWTTDGSSTPAPVRRRSISSFAPMEAGPSTQSQWTPLAPMGRFRLVWDVSSIVCLTLDVILLPLHAFSQWKAAATLTVFEMLLQLFWAVDIAAPWFWRSIDSEDSKSKQMGPLRKNYIRGWLSFDVLYVALGLAWVVLQLANPTQAALSFVTALGCMQLFLRLIRLMRLTKMAESCKTRLTSDILIASASILQLSAQILLNHHAIACIWYYVGTVAGSAGWVAVNNVDSQPVLYRYTTSLNYLFCQLGFGGTGIEPGTTLERLFGLFTAVQALAIFSTLVASLTSHAAFLNKSGEERRNEFRLLRKFLARSQVEEDLAQRIQRFLEHAHALTKEVVDEIQVPLLRLLSKPLWRELHYAMYKHCLGEIGFVRSLSRCSVSDDLNADATRQLSQALSQRLLAAGDTIFESGSLALDAYFLIKTSVYNLGQLRQPVSDCWVAEMGLWSPWCHLGELVTTEASVNVRLQVEKFAECLRRSWSLLQLAQHYAAKYVQVMNETVRITDLWQCPASLGGDAVPSLWPGSFRRKCHR
ncbi:KCNH6 [Symbiodinium pilosum]|uniref:KCNH6 protein n=1 Tax=Symbiodinium pilosum TaxID=2952 RepID=A0A812WUC0_SYMPI|nr:KCNH6 [Symbiodinium pilosum]